MINELIPAKFRKPVYFGYALLGVVLGAIEVAYLEMDVAAPTWVGVAMTVYLFVGGAVGLTAGVHTPTNPLGARSDVFISGESDMEADAIDEEIRNMKRRDLRE